MGISGVSTHRGLLFNYCTLHNVSTMADIILTTFCNLPLPLFSPNNTNVKQITAPTSERQLTWWDGREPWPRGVESRLLNPCVCEVRILGRGVITTEKINYHKCRAGFSVALDPATWANSSSIHYVALGNGRIRKVQWHHDTQYPLQYHATTTIRRVKTHVIKDSSTTGSTAAVMSST